MFNEKPHKNCVMYLKTIIQLHTTKDFEPWIEKAKELI